MTKSSRVFRSVLWLILGSAASPVAAQDRTAAHTVDQQTIDKWKKSESNWGRWGPQDDKGTLNLITPAVRARAAATVKRGISVSLEREIVPEMAGADSTPSGRPAPVQQRILSGPPTRPSGSTNLLSIAAHGYTITHFDALGHHFFDGRMYNGFPADGNFSMVGGLARGSIAAAADGVFTRGVLVDIPRLKGLPYLEPGTPIYVEDLEAWEKFAGVRIGPGDAIFIRTGRWEREAAKGAWDIAKSSAGLDASVIPWLRRRDVALIGSESALSVVPFPATTRITDPDDYLPVHNFALVALGMPLIDNTDLGPLSRMAASLKRYTFLLTVAPIRVKTGTGVPVNPVATF